MPWLVVGLGNPGTEYARTRHNLGAMTLELLAERCGGRLRSAKGGFLALQTQVAGRATVLVRPTSFMNLSGAPVAAAVRFYKASPDELVVVHDELDIPFGELRVKRGGGSGGHNGLKDIDRALGSRDYCRVRVGIGRPPGRTDPADYVLRDFAGPERKELPLVIDTAADAVERLLADGLDAAQQAFNGRPA